MSKSIKTNRNIQSLSSLSCYLSPEGSKKCFGELIEKEFSPPFYKPKFDAGRDVISPPFYKSKLSSKSIPKVGYDLDTESIISGVSDLKLIQSLSSSPSWSDDFDIEGSKRVQDELEQMDRVLRGVDPIPLHYDVDEYKQWMETFPSLSLFGNKECGPYKIWKDEKNTNEIEVSSSTNKAQSAKLSRYKTEIKKAVIHNIYENISIRLNSSSNPPSSSEMKKRQSQIGDINKTQLYLNNCLKKSPFSDIIKEKYVATRFLTRNSSKDDENIHFESLPTMLGVSTRTSAKPLNKHKNEPMSAISRKKSRRSIILPPIQNKWAQTSNQIRSISATPTHSSLFSARTLKMDSKLLSGKPRNAQLF